MNTGKHLRRITAVLLACTFLGVFTGCGNSDNTLVLNKILELESEVSELRDEVESLKEASETKAEEPAKEEEVQEEEKETETSVPEEEPEPQETEAPEPVLAKAGGPSEHGQLRVEDGVLKDANGNPFQLRGMSTHGIGWFPDYINAGAMEDIKNHGGNVFRIAMYTQADSGYIYDPDRNMQLVEKGIELAKAADLYVIVDWHILDDGDPNIHIDKATTFFDTVASNHANDPAILYELCNEPNNTGWDAIERYAYTACSVVRQRSPQAVLILGTPDYSSKLQAPMDEPFPQADNLMYAFHYYAGEHQDFSALQNAVDRHLPVFVSEWGIGKDNSGSPALDAGRNFVDYLNANGISWCAWSLCNKDEVYSVLRPDCSKLSGWEESDFTDVGKLIFGAMGG